MEPDSSLIDLVHPTGNQNVRAVLQALEESHRLGVFHTALGFSEERPPRFVPGTLRSECLRRSYAVAPSRLRARPGREAVPVWRRRNFAGRS